MLRSRLVVNEIVKSVSPPFDITFHFRHGLSQGIIASGWQFLGIEQLFAGCRLGSARDHHRLLYDRNRLSKFFAVFDYDEAVQREDSCNGINGLVPAQRGSRL